MQQQNTRNRLKVTRGVCEEGEEFLLLRFLTGRRGQLALGGSPAAARDPAACCLVEEDG